MLTMAIPVSDENDVIERIISRVFLFVKPESINM
jgi:hypothetical protein